MDELYLPLLKVSHILSIFFLAVWGRSFEIAPAGRGVPGGAAVAGNRPDPSGHLVADWLSDAGHCGVPACSAAQQVCRRQSKAGPGLLVAEPGPRVFVVTCHTGGGQKSKARDGPRRFESKARRPDRPAYRWRTPESVRWSGVFICLFRSPFTRCSLTGCSGVRSGKLENARFRTPGDVQYNRKKPAKPRREGQAVLQRHRGPRWRRAHEATTAWRRRLEGVASRVVATSKISIGDDCGEEWGSPAGYAQPGTAPSQ